MQLDHIKVRDIFEGFTGDSLPPGLLGAAKEFLEAQHLYHAATREVTTKLENLNDEFRYLKSRNPIHQIVSRVKNPKSIAEKLMRKGFELSIDSARDNLDDIAGIRVICSYVEDIYTIADLLLKQDDITVIRQADYIKNPKQNGYRSLHLIVSVPVFLSDRKEHVKVEIQVRTIAMDFWASLEHELAYKMDSEGIRYIQDELKACADVIAQTDLRMQALHNRI